MLLNEFMYNHSNGVIYDEGVLLYTYKARQLFKKVRDFNFKMRKKEGDQPSKKQYVFKKPLEQEHPALRDSHRGPRYNLGFRM